MNNTQSRDQIAIDQMHQEIEELKQFKTPEERLQYLVKKGEMTREQAESFLKNVIGER